MRVVVTQEFGMVVGRWWCIVNHCDMRHMYEIGFHDPYNIYCVDHDGMHVYCYILLCMRATHEMAV